MEEKFEKYLPVGTVVMLKGGKKRVMITGFCSIAEENKEKTYDYSGCLYPEGYLSANQVCLFDHEQIDKIYHLGLIDEEEKAFKLKLDSFMKNVDSSTVATSSQSTVDIPAAPAVEAPKVEEKIEEVDVNEINLNTNLNEVNPNINLNLEEDNESNNDDDFFVI